MSVPSWWVLNSTGSVVFFDVLYPPFLIGLFGGAWAYSIPWYTLAGKTQNPNLQSYSTAPETLPPALFFTGPVRAPKSGPGPIRNLVEQTEEQTEQLNVYHLPKCISNKKGES